MGPRVVDGLMDGSVCLASFLCSIHPHLIKHSLHVCFNACSSVSPVIVRSLWKRDCFESLGGVGRSPKEETGTWEVVLLRSGGRASLRCTGRAAASEAEFLLLERFRHHLA